MRDDMIKMAGYGEEKLSNVFIYGKVVCHEENYHDCNNIVKDDNNFELGSRPMSGEAAYDGSWGSGVGLLPFFGVSTARAHDDNFTVTPMLPFTTNLTCDNHISGASIGVFCGSSGKTRRSWARNTTDEDGEFLIDLPSHLHAIPNLEKTCCVKVLHLPRDTICRHAFRGQHKGLELASIGEGIRTYTTQTIHLTPKAATRPCGKKVVVM
ncbi:putative fumarylacetoacetase-like [Capsicum annuum]|nr:putative fumarylacetoacetase-like [Capsicum annuum]